MIRIGFVLSLKINSAFGKRTNLAECHVLYPDPMLDNSPDIWSDTKSPKAPFQLKLVATTLSVEAVISFLLLQELHLLMGQLDCGVS
jgi:hypothetical protein